ncbi:MAG: trypsin-like peptidase domain-containing protein [Planctomycetaceae bacterium]|nr:trypsin-like peptidase domain-containing protein [Planctomycetaceae bacterium]
MNIAVRSLASLLFLGCMATITLSPVVAAEPSEDVASTPNDAARQLSKLIRKAANEASPGLVTVYALRGPRMTTPWRLRAAAGRHHTSPASFQRQTASSIDLSSDDQGSGLVLDASGCILTCSHVVSGANAVFVRTADGQQLHAAKVSCDPVTDLAVIHVDAAEQLTPVQFGDSDAVEIGDWVVSLASPYDLDQSISAGIVTTAGRWVSSCPYPLIQNDAATNPGSSGGALLNLNGKVIGLIIGGYSTRGEFQGIGLAIPINAAKDIIQQLRIQGYVQRGYFGFDTQQISPEMASLLKLSNSDGLYVTDVMQASPAHQAGMLEGDVLTTFDGHRIDESFDPQSFTADLTPSKKHIFTVNRGKEAVEIEVELQLSLPPAINPRVTPEQPSKESFEFFDSQLGIGLNRIDKVLARELDLPFGTKGALVTHVAMDSIAYREGIAAGMVITRINDHSIDSVTTYRQTIASRTPAQPTMLLLQSNQGKHLMMLKIKEPRNVNGLKLNQTE